MDRHAFGYRDDESNACIGLFEDGIHCEGSGDEDEAGVGAGCCNGLSSGFEIGDFVHELGSGTVRMHCSNHVGAIFDDALRLKRAVTAQSLHQQSAWVFN